jgi:hypothetical protein
MKPKSDLNVSTKFRITLKTWFKKTYDEEEVKESDEEYGLIPEECTDHDCFCFSATAKEGGKKEFDMDTFMLRNFNYEKYAVAVMFGFIDDERELLTDFVYQDDGIISFTFTQRKGDKKLTPSKIKEEILMDSFEDGIYEGTPGDEAIVALNSKYKDKYEPSGYIHQELGVIDCRRKECIKVIRL